MPDGDFVVAAFLAEVTVAIPINKVLDRIPLYGHNLVTAQKVEDIVARSVSKGILRLAHHIEIENLQIDQIDTMLHSLILNPDSLNSLSENLAGLGYKLIGVDRLILKEEQPHILLAYKPLTEVEILLNVGCGRAVVIGYELGSQLHRIKIGIPHQFGQNPRFQLGKCSAPRLILPLFVQAYSIILLEGLDIVGQDGKVGTRREILTEIDHIIPYIEF